MNYTFYLIEKCDFVNYANDDGLPNNVSSTIEALIYDGMSNE